MLSVSYSRGIIPAERTVDFYMWVRSTCQQSLADGQISETQLARLMKPAMFQGACDTLLSLQERRGPFSLLGHPGVMRAMLQGARGDVILVNPLRADGYLAGEDLFYNTDQKIFLAQPRFWGQSHVYCIKPLLDDSGTNASEATRSILPRFHSGLQFRVKSNGVVEVRDLTKGDLAAVLLRKNRDRKPGDPRYDRLTVERQWNSANDGDMVFSYGRRYRLKRDPVEGPSLQLLRHPLPQIGKYLRPCGDSILEKQLFQAACVGDPVSVFQRDAPRGLRKVRGEIVAEPVRSGWHYAAFGRTKAGQTVMIAGDNILTIRKGDDNRTKDFFPIRYPFLQDLAVIAPQNGLEHWTLIDLSDPKLVAWLKDNFYDLRERNMRELGGNINNNPILFFESLSEAKKRVERLVPYDKERYKRWVDKREVIPDRLYLLSEFLEKGICNERSALFQVVLQYIGIAGTKIRHGKWKPEHRNLHGWVQLTVQTPEGVEIAIYNLDDPVVHSKHVADQRGDFRTGPLPFLKSRIPTS